VRMKYVYKDKSMPFTRSASIPVKIRLLLDRSVVEVFVDRSAVLTLVLPPVYSAYRVELFSDRTSTTVRQLDLWRM
jgi:sucrose-6-phosphate hydrolase SacC (GH32 family)